MRSSPAHLRVTDVRQGPGRRAGGCGKRQFPGKHPQPTRSLTPLFLCMWRTRDTFKEPVYSIQQHRTNTPYPRGMMIDTTRFPCRKEAVTDHGRPSLFSGQVRSISHPRPGKSSPDGQKSACSLVVRTREHEIIHALPETGKNCGFTSLHESIQ